MAREQAEQDRLMLERLQAMALADLSQREMQSEFGRICHPIDEQQSAINSAEGLLTNWLNRFSNTAGFLEGVTTHCERLEFEAQIFREKFSAFYDTLQEAKIPAAYENWFSSVIDYAHQLRSSIDTYLMTIASLPGIVQSQDARTAAKLLDNAHSSLQSAMHHLTSNRVFASQKQENGFDN
ncbi:hypothetical protein WR25_00510 [Diploscapter pachys]|uniref:Uncharacterized protein n=1 Tax=Diploscapter pachys TaxID=2018661 RepID=A0A2A2KXU9_9BILA|nr:hypothetical protein WR25_00510 [Diploscapter pachys]